MPGQRIQPVGIDHHRLIDLFDQPAYQCLRSFTITQPGTDYNNIRAFYKLFYSFQRSVTQRTVTRLQKRKGHHLLRLYLYQRAVDTFGYRYSHQAGAGSHRPSGAEGSGSGIPAGTGNDQNVAEVAFIGIRASA
jgi:hypothetical protein